MDWFHPALELVEILSILAIIVWGGHLLREMHVYAEAWGALSQRVSEIATRDDRKMDELLLTQAVMLRRLEQIERRLSRGTD